MLYYKLIEYINICRLYIYVCTCIYIHFFITGQLRKADRAFGMDKAKRNFKSEQLLNLDPEANRKERGRILKNVILISLGFLLNFTAYSV